jgi:hypothetical protein
MPSNIRVLRVLASTLALRGSRDRSMLDLLITVDDLPPGWHQKREARYRVGLFHDDDWDKRARREKLVGATRVFESPQTGSRIAAQAIPLVTDEDVRSMLSAFPARWLRSSGLKAGATQEAEVAPPPEAGENARARLVSTIGQTGASRKLSVVWPEPGSLLLGIEHTAPPEVEAYDLMSRLIERQRDRLATKPEV